MPTRSWTWRFDAPPPPVWTAMADTARFNEAAGLPKHTIVETPRPDGSVEYLGKARKGPFELEWREHPVNWVHEKWFEHRRTFLKGPLKSLCATFRLSPDGQGCSGHYTIDAEAANLIGAPLAKFAHAREPGLERGIGYIDIEADDMHRQPAPGD